MRLALVPIRLAPGKKNENAQTMARWVERLHPEVDLIVFPKIPFGALPIPGNVDDGSADQSDLIRAFAGKRTVHIAAGLHHTRRTGQLNMLVLADRTGQALTRNQRAPARNQDVIPPPPLYLTATVAGVPIGITHSNDRLDDGLTDLIEPDQVRLLIVMMALAGEEDEHRRIAAHNPPRALERLKGQLAQLASVTRTPVLAVNAIAPDTADECGPCGGLYALDASGKFTHEQRLYDETAHRAEIPTQ